MMKQQAKRPKCRLPATVAISFLIGNTVSTLRDAGMSKEMRDFINRIRRKDSDLDFRRIKEIAEEYVDFLN